MAAASVGVRHQHDRKRAGIDGEEVRIGLMIPTDEMLILKRGFLSRQTMIIAGVIYTNRSVIVTAECIYFSKSDKGGVLDYIPLLEIQQQSLSEGHNSGRSTILIAKNEAEKSEWKSLILSAVQQAPENQRLSLKEPGFIARMQFWPPSTLAGLLSSPTQLHHCVVHIC